MKIPVRFTFLLGITLMGLPVLGCGQTDRTPEAGPQADSDAPNPQAPAAQLAAFPQEVADHYEIRTPMGRLVVRLYDDTPVHKQNFARLASEAFFDSTTFHRVIQGFMIQGGDPLSKDEDLTNDGAGGPGYTIPAEIHPERHHKRGALAAARTGDQVNPQRASSGSQFFIVTGGPPFVAGQLDQIESDLRVRMNMPGFAFTEAARNDYTTTGGAPHLDAQYTVFGELVEGFDVLDAIAGLPTLRKRYAENDPTLEGPIDQRLIDQPPQRIWMVVRPLPDYRPAASDSL